MLHSVSELEESIYYVKKNILRMAYECQKSSHIGGSLSMADMLTVLYKEYLRFDVNRLDWEDRDRFILSKGHCVLAYYAVLRECQILSDNELALFQKNGSLFGTHPTMNIQYGIESSNGSLGQGISMAVGIAKAGKIKGKNYHIYTLVGNGECNEGSVWEAAMLAAQWKLDNLTVILDNNHMQSDGDSEAIISTSEMKQKWDAFGFHTQVIDGHDVPEICHALEIETSDRPKVIIGNTVKGYGVSFMENNNEWHHNRLTQKLYEQACAELEENRNGF